MAIPTKPEAIAPKRKSKGVLGTQIDLVAELDKKYRGDKDSLVQKVAAICRKREDSGEENFLSQLQPFYKPLLEDLLGKRIGVLFDLLLEDSRECTLRWCQGECAHVCNDCPQPTAKVTWDDCLDTGGRKKGKEANQVLLPKKWNKDTDQAWRMDIHINSESKGEEDDAQDCTGQGGGTESRCSNSELSAGSSGNGASGSKSGSDSS